MWIKFALAVAIILFCTFLGYLAAGKARTKSNFYLQFSAFNERYLNEIEYARKPLSAFLSMHEYAGEFGGVVKRFSERKDVLPKENFLSEEEKSELKDYFSMLGNGDTSSQKEYFSIRTKQLAGKAETYRKEAKERGELYLKLGLLFGLAVVILIV